MSSSVADEVDDVDQRAEAHKAAGNKHLKKKDYSAAVKAYSDGIELATSIRHKLYSNRSLAHLRLGKVRLRSFRPSTRPFVHA